MTDRSLTTRRRILRLVEEFPGLHLRELARQAGTSEPLAGYHLANLVADDIVEAVTEGGFKRFYVRSGPQPSERDRAILELLRHAAPLQIVVFLLERDGATHPEIAEETGLSKSTVTYHLHRLRGASLVEHVPTGAGFQVREARRIESLLLRWEPPRDITDRFERLWRSFYRRRGDRKKA